MRKKRKQNAGLGNAGPSIAFAAPALLVYTLLFVLPMLIALLASTTNWSGLAINLEKLRFVGLQNFSRMLKDRALLESVRTTFIITFVVGVISNVGGLFLAVILTKKIRLNNTIRCIFFIPYILSSVSIAFIWMAILSYNGLLNSLLEILGFAKLNIFQSATASTVAICIVEIWRTMGFYMVLYIAALQSVPQDLSEAAYIDGANGWQTFRMIKLPMIAQQLVIGFIMSLTTELRLYDLVKILTNGGPGTSTRTIAYTIVTQGFNNQRMGYAGAIAFALSAIIILLTVISRVIQNKLEVKQ